MSELPSPRKLEEASKSQLLTGGGGIHLGPCAATQPPASPVAPIPSLLGFFPQNINADNVSYLAIRKV